MWPNQARSRRGISWLAWESWLAEQAAALSLSRDALARGWLALDIEAVTTETIDKLGRQRITTRRIAHPAWTLERNGNSGE